ncbi:MAG TPA: HIT domain-containing protein [Acidobacteriaceae bacterium]|nr:HIT domain-containing protein [Acidobacteriaceae bacterium]
MNHLWTPWRYTYVTQPKDQNPETRDARAGVPVRLAAWPGDCHCVFCNLIAAADYAIEHGMTAEEADHAANIVLRGRTCYICLNAYPYSSGHVMIVPYVHEGSLAALAADAALEMMELSQRSIRAQERVYSPDGFNMGLNMGTAAGAGVAGHLHMHVLPRWLGDTNFMTVTGETRVLPEMLEQSWQRLREALASI